MDICAWFDASVKPMERKSRIAWVITANGEIIKRYGTDIDYVKSVQKVEYLALVSLLHELVKWKVKKVKIYGDNLGIIQRLNEQCRVKQNNKRINVLHIEAKSLLLGISEHELSWVPRKQNKLADKIAQGSGLRK